LGQPIGARTHALVPLSHAGSRTTVEVLGRWGRSPTDRLRRPSVASWATTNGNRRHLWPLVESGEPIPDERFEAVPTAERTVEEQAHFERQEVVLDGVAHELALERRRRFAQLLPQELHGRRASQPVL
jgi:hypothetical protein